MPAIHQCSTLSGKTSRLFDVVVPDAADAKALAILMSKEQPTHYAAIVDRNGVVPCASVFRALIRNAVNGDYHAA